MQAFKTEPVHSKGVQEQQGNVTSQNFQHQNTLNPEHAPQQDSGKVSWEVTPASSSCCQGLTGPCIAQKLRHRWDAQLPELTHLRDKEKRRLSHLCFS